MSLLGLLVGAMAVGEWRLNRKLVLLGAAVFAFWIADSRYLVSVATGTYSQADWYNGLWYLSPVLAAWAGWVPTRAAAATAGASRGVSARGIAMLLGFAVTALVVLCASSFVRVGPVAIGLAALHDVGKVAIPDPILDKPTRLDDHEWKFIRRHTLIGERIITAAPALIKVGALVRSSHENFDGTGYPDQLKGDAIPLGSRIISVCDAFNAMTTDRPYRPTMTHASALAELRRCAGSQFDPEVVEQFCLALGRRDSLSDAACTGALGPSTDELRDGQAQLVDSL